MIRPLDGLGHDHFPVTPFQSRDPEQIGADQSNSRQNRKRGVRMHEQAFRQHDPAVESSAMVKRIFLSLFPILGILNAGCSRFSSKQAELLDLKLKCAEAGRHFDADRRREAKGSTKFLFPSRVAYNGKLNTCIYESSDFTPGVDGPGLGVSYYFIIDLATNQPLASYTYRKSDPDASQAEAEKFRQRARELFGSAVF